MSQYVVRMYTAGKASQPVTIPMTKREAEKLAGKFNDEHEAQNIDPNIQHFYVERNWN